MDWHRFEMGHCVIHSFNGIALGIILIGVPSVTSIRFGAFQIGSRPLFEILTIGLIVAILAVNLLGWLLAKSKNRAIWFRWIALLLMLLGTELAYFSGYLRFDWLEESLRWMQSRF